MPDNVIKTKARAKPRAKTEPRKAKDSDETTRVSIHESAAQPGPAFESEGKTEDERGAKGPRTKKGDVVLPEGERHSHGEDRPRPSDDAARQPLRDTHAPTGVSEIKVDGEKVQQVATPVRVDPVELKPSKRDTVVKDRLRADGNAEKADAPVRRPVGGDWHDTDVRTTVDDGPEPTKKKRKVAE